MDEKNHYGKKLEEFINNNVPKPTETTLENFLNIFSVYPHYFEINCPKNTLIISNKGPKKTQSIILFEISDKSNSVNILYTSENVIIKEGIKEIIYNPLIINGSIIGADNNNPSIKSVLYNNYSIYRKLPEKIFSLPCMVKKDWGISCEERILCFVSEMQECLDDYYHKTSLEISRLNFENQKIRPVLR